MNELEENKSKTEIEKLHSIDFDQLEKYGSKAQDQLSNISDNILKQVNNKDMESVSSDIIKLVQELHDNSNSNTEKNFFMSFLNRQKKRVINIKTRNESINKNLNDIQKCFVVDQDKLKMSISALEQLEENALKHVSILEEYIENGKDKLKNITDVEIPKAKQMSQTENTIEHENYLTNLNYYADQLSHKLEELTSDQELSRQSLIQLKLTQAAERQMYQKISSTLNITIPQMKQQLAIQIQQQQLDNVIHDQSVFDEINNQIIKKNADDFHSNTVSVAKMINNTSINPETLEHSFAELKQTVEEIRQIDIDSHNQRQSQMAHIKELSDETEKMFKNVFDSKRID